MHCILSFYVALCTSFTKVVSKGVEVSSFHGVPDWMGLTLSHTHFQPVFCNWPADYITISQALEHTYSLVCVSYPGTYIPITGLVCKQRS